MNNLTYYLAYQALMKNLPLENKSIHHFNYILLFLAEYLYTLNSRFYNNES